MARVSAARVWKWIRLVGRNYTSIPILLTLLAWHISSSWLIGYYIANTGFVFISPYAFSVGIGGCGGTTTEFYSFDYSGSLSAVIGIQTRPEIYSVAGGQVAIVPFWLVIAVFCPIAFVQWRRTIRELRIPPGHCPTCGYDLTGNISGVCPECGGKVTAMANSEERIANSEVTTKPPARFREGF